MSVAPETPKELAARLRAEAMAIEADARAKSTVARSEAEVAASKLKLRNIAEKTERLNAKRRARLHIADADDEAENAWRHRLIRSVDRDGIPYTMPIMANVVTILRFHPSWRGVLAFDAFSECIAHALPPPWDPAAAPEKVDLRDRRETDLARVVDWLDRNELVHVNTRLVAEAVAVVAESQTVHPVVNYLESLPAWDGIPRIFRWLSTYGGATHNEYTANVGSRWLISAVARVMRPGCQVDCMLIVEDRAQGSGKTSLFRSLVPHESLYSETGITIGDKDSYQNIHGVWLYLLDEIDSIRKGDTTRIKNFISSCKDRYRPSYARAARDFPRQNVFCGTTNETEYLVDRANRRFWPYRVTGAIDLIGLARDRDLLWAEALHRFRDGEVWHVDTPWLRSLCELEQADRVQSNPWEPVIAAWLESPDYEVEHTDDHGATRPHREPFRIQPPGPTTAEILRHALRYRPEAMTPSASSRAAITLAALGYTEVTRARESGDWRTIARRYSKPSPIPTA